MGTASRREPALNIPLPILAWIALLVAIQAGRALLSTQADLHLLIETAFVPAPWSIAFGTQTPESILASLSSGDATPEDALRALLARIFVQDPPRPWALVSYSLLHGSWGHLGINGLMLVVFGSSVVRRIGLLPSLALWLAAAIGGAFAQWLYDPKGVDFVIGASASVSGFMAAAATFVFARPGDGRWDFLTNRGALTLLGLWLAANAGLGLVLAPLGLADGDVAWASHIGGLLVGLGLCPVLAPRLRTAV